MENDFHSNNSQNDNLESRFWKNSWRCSEAANFGVPVGIVIVIVTSRRCFARSGRASLSLYIGWGVKAVIRDEEHGFS